MTFFEGLTANPYQEVLTQYFDATGRIGSTVTVDSWTDTREGAPKNVGGATEEVAYALSQNHGWSREANAQFAVFPAPGTTYAEGFTGFCAYHNYDSYKSVYLMVPYAGDEPFKEEDGCQGYYGKGDPAKATSLMASHEYAEAATDPIWDTEPGWFDTEGYENGDLCATPYDELPNGAFVQGTYDDHQNACSLGDKSPPQVLGLTEQATNVTEHGAHMHGTINPESLATTYQFEYGTTTSYGSKTPAEPTSAGSGRSNVAVEAVLRGLTRDQVYHYRLVATNSSGTTYGEDQTFYPSKWLDRVAPQGAQWTSSGLAGVSCTSAEFCMTVGNDRDLYYNGTAEVNRLLSYELHNGQWEQRVVPQEASDAWPGLNDVSCVTASACTAVGQAYDLPSKRDYAIADRWNGKEWAIQHVPVPSGALESQLNGVSCPSLTECVAVGYVVTATHAPENFVVRWKEGAWEIASAPTQEGTTWDELQSVSCPSSSFCVAAGYYGLSAGPSQPTLMRWNGKNWSLMTPSQSGAALWGVSCTSETFCAAVNLFGDTEVWNGSSWSTKAGASTPDLNGYGLEGASCSSATTCVASGYGVSKINGAAVSLVEEWNGTSWTEQTTPRESERFANGLAGVSCAGPLSCTAVGGTFTRGAEGTALINTRQLPVTPAKSKSIGSSGSGDGQLNYPRGIAIDPNGNFWVADSGNNRIEKFNSKGEFISKFGSAGTGKGQFNTPVDVAIDSEGNLLITDALNSRVQKFNPQGEWLATIGSNGTGAGHFLEPSGIAVDSSTGNFWVSDHLNSCVQEFNAKGEYVRTSPVSFSGPEGLAIDSEGHLFVVDAPANRVVELSSTGELIRQFGSGGLADGQFAEPTVVDIRPSGELLVADRESARVQEFSPSGEYLTQFQVGSEPINEGPSAEPDGIAATGGGVLYASSSRNNVIERFAEAPMAITNEAEGVGPTQATLTGTVNPGGQATTYQFEYGTTSTYGQVTPSVAKEAGAGTTEVTVSAEAAGLQEQTTYHYRLVAKSAMGTSYGKDRTYTTPVGTPGRLKAMAVTDPFNGTNSAVSNFGSSWTALGWAAGTTPKGENSASGWHPTASFPTVNGALLNRTVTDLGTGTAVAATMSASPVLAERYFDLWLDQPVTNSSRAGYEAKFETTISGEYTVTLARWKEGNKTLLGSKASVAISNGNSLALTDQGSTVGVWINSGSGFTLMLSAEDETFSAGTAGVEGSGSYTRLTNFKVGSLLDPTTNMDGALKGLSVRDQFSTAENPLSEGGLWTALAWDNGASGHNTGQVATGWGPYDAYPTINGASWQKAALPDTGAGDGVAATLTARPGSTSRYFGLDLNAPSPGSAHSGYDVRFIETASNVYEVTLDRWTAGVKSGLASKTGYSFPVGSKLALVEKGGTVSAWTNTGTGFTQILSASDSTYMAGYGGVEGSGYVTRLSEFKAGPLPPF